MALSSKEGGGEKLGGGSWKKVETHDGVECHAKQVKGTYAQAFRLETTCKCSMSSLIDILGPRLVSRHKEWNDTFQEGRVVIGEAKENEGEQVDFMSYKAGPLALRDFLVGRRVIKKDDGTVLFVDKSVEHPAQLHRPGAIRSNLLFSVRQLQPQSDGTVRLTYMNATELGGWVPAWLTNRLNPKVSIEEIQHIKRMCERDTAQEAGNQ
eukprot:comp12708_c0_seq2/m.7807 comp12708_c0_seq2/g.7807  ORF comp12708_c0_seq2/g.7807 comp12708_c0_seq2/m.7807 type:complete len:209 (-) comp12708_c0_seq2:268-894(-)